MTPAELIKLAAHVEALQGPCRETNWAVMDACGVGPRDYTGSIDAAATLVPAGWKWSLYLTQKAPYQDCAIADLFAPGDGYCPPDVSDVYAATPALALCAAALRSRAASADGEPT